VQQDLLRTLSPAIAPSSIRCLRPARQIGARHPDRAKLDPVRAVLVEASMPAQGNASEALPQALFAVAYGELRRIARKQRRAAGDPVTLDTTALVHEVYLKLHAIAETEPMEREHFVSLAARAMRQVLVDHARGRARLKRGGDCIVTDLGDRIGVASDLLDLVVLDEALSRLSEFDPRAGQLVEWHVFGGLGIADIARMQGLTERTVFRDWRKARAFLIGQLGLDAPGR
jgi:RNA polymerase sigma factor (TIGR02999 family)